MKIFLLTHERELDRATNTGAIAINHSAGLVERVLWQRVHPSNSIVENFNANNALLLYPTDDETCVNIKDFNNIVIIDSTWQEAQKIYNQSPYLKAAPKAVLSSAPKSTFQLRRNQPDGGLCTVETVIEVLKIKQQYELAEKLTIEFNLFNQR